MKTLRTLLLLLFVTSGTNSALCQELKLDGYKIIIKSFETRLTGMHSKKYALHSGMLKVKTKDGQKGNYLLTFMELGDEVTLLSFRNEQNQGLAPKLIYNKAEKEFKYGNATVEEKEKERQLLDGNKSPEEIVLVGMLIWLKLDK